MLIHSNSGSTHPLVASVMSFICNGAVPVFFLLSGYLSARKLDSPSCSLREFGISKWHGLIIPFLFWTILTLVLIFSAKAAGLDKAVKGGGHYFGVEPNVESIFSSMFGIGRPLIIYQFWFLRDLIVANFAAFFIIRYLPRIPLLPLLLFFVPIPMMGSLAYFLTGHELKRFQFADLEKILKGTWIYCLSWLVLGAGITLWKESIPDPIGALGSAAFLIFLAHLIGLSSAGRKLATLGATTFFIYAVHEPAQTIIDKIWTQKGWPGHGSFALFIGIPLAVFVVSTIGYKLLARLSPKSLALMTGGRSSQ